MKAAAQAILAIVPACILAGIAKKDESRVELPDSRRSFFVFTSAQLIWLGLLAAALIVMIGINVLSANPEGVLQAAGNILMDSQVVQAVTMTEVVSLLTGLLAGFAAYSFVCFMRGGRKGFGLAMILLASAQSCMIGEYLAFRNLGIQNTPYAVVLRMVCDPKLISLMIVLAVSLRMAPERNARWLVVGLMLLGAAFTWGDYFSSMLYINDSSLFPISIILRNVGIMGNVSGITPEMTELEMLTLQASVPVLTLLTALPPVLLGFGGAGCFIRAFKKAE